MGHEVVIVGGGFGGLYAAQSLRRAPVRVTLVDRRNFHLFQPLLYQVAIGGLSPANVAAPLRAILKKQANARVLLAEVVGVAARRRVVILRDGEIGFDTLILAAGARHHYFGHDAWERDAPGLKTIEDATEIRRRILLAFERAERLRDPVELEATLTFVIVGGGPTGVELAGAIAETARGTLRRDFRAIDPSRARIRLVEAGDRILAGFPPELSTRAADALRRLGVGVETGTSVADVTAESVLLRTGDGGERRVAARTVLWAAGVAASPLARALAEETGVSLDRAGRVVVGPDLTVPGYPEIFVIGDMAHVVGADRQPLPGVATVAMQQGRYVARRIAERLRQRESGAATDVSTETGGTLAGQAAAAGAFRYRDPGIMATIGRAAAVARIGRFQFSGYPAWLLWLFVHLVHLIEFQNRLLVLIQWAWNYFTRNRAARLITGEERRGSGKT
ncbi:MAG: NADH dehydrogenase-like protein [Phycisphaerae bacterium]|nr:NADH dehydrogenase-like protein [Phycisphaerae bacterium]